MVASLGMVHLKRPGLLFGALSVCLASCTFINLSTLASFACNDGGVCAEGLSCCADSQCRIDCSADGGGLGGGQGGGTHTGGGQGGGGGTASYDAGICAASTCPTGCCDGTVCRTGNAPAQCGRGGIACQTCSATGDACINGTCSGCAASCVTGCCVGSTCTPRATNSCGGNGQLCVNCGIGADSCSATGECQCGGSRPCGTGQRCSLGQCVCDATSCANGCCTASGQCLRLADQSSTQCGLANSCAVCMSPPAALCTTSSVRRAFAAPGGCESGTCAYVSQEQTCTNGCSGTPDGGICIGDVCQGCLLPPATVCVGNVRRSFASPGTCGNSGCSYAPQDTTCPFGCSAGACNIDPCSNVACTTPPAPVCDGANRRSSVSPGTCLAGACSYSTQTAVCPQGCNAATGNCNDDLCAAVTCDKPPAASCLSSTTRRSYVSPGACSGGTCTYSIQDVTCATGCANAQCQGDACSGVACNTQQPAVCVGNNLQTYSATGACSGGACTYPSSSMTCTFGCATGACKPDPCASVTCNQPPNPYCSGAVSFTFAATGTCSAGNCDYPATQTTCPFGCMNGACKPDPCASVVCNTPPAAFCANASTRRTYSTGLCSGGTCDYSGAYTDTPCSFGCNNGSCNPDPCAGVNCSATPPPICSDATTRHIYSGGGTCSAGVCGSYPSSDQPCNTPPPSTCSAGTLTSFSGTGTCSGAAVCSYSASSSSCMFGCNGTANGCAGDPCSGVNCPTPAPICADGVTRRVFTGPGTCSGGMCGVAPSSDSTCGTPATVCVSATVLRMYGAGYCSAGACGNGLTDTDCSTSAVPASDCVGNSRRIYTAGSGLCSSNVCQWSYTLSACGSQRRCLDGVCEAMCTVGPPGLCY